MKHEQWNRIHTGFWPGNLNERNLGIGGWAIIKTIILGE
jgi:hypothetical protein